MKQFRYSLDTLLSLRRETEREKETALAAAAGLLTRVQNQREELLSSGDRIFQKGGNDLEDWRARDRYYTRSLKEREKLRPALAEARTAWEKAKDDYTQAHRDRRALEKVREKRKEEWRQERRRKENHLLDETAQGSLIRRRLKEGVYER